VSRAVIRVSAQLCSGRAARQHVPTHSEAGRTVHAWCGCGLRRFRLGNGHSSATRGCRVAARVTGAPRPRYALFIDWCLHQCPDKAQKFRMLRPFAISNKEVAN
jgi:hypothetical protein